MERSKWRINNCISILLNKYTMTQNINIEGIVTMMRQLPTKYNTPVIEIARGKFKKPTTLRERIKRFTKWLMKK